MEGKRVELRGWQSDCLVLVLVGMGYKRLELRVVGCLSLSLSPSRDGGQKGGAKRGQSVLLVLVGMGYKRQER